MSKYAAIYTPDYRLRLMGFSHPDSTKTKEYVNGKGDVVIRCQRSYLYGIGWYWYVNGEVREYSFSKRLLIDMMERSGVYSLVQS